MDPSLLLFWLMSWDRDERVVMERQTGDFSSHYYLVGDTVAD